MLFLKKITHNLGKTDAVFFHSCGDILLFIFGMFQGKSAILVVSFYFSWDGGYFEIKESFPEGIDYIVLHFEDKNKEIWLKMKGNKMSKICISLNGHWSKEEGVIHICSIRLRQGNKE